MGTIAELIAKAKCRQLHISHSPRTDSLKEPLYHLASHSDAKLIDAGNDYSTDSLDSEGFIHCCTAEQMPGVLQRYYADTQELVLLCIEPAALTSTLTFENTVGGTELFPHIYGKINHAAIIAMHSLQRAELDEIAASERYSG